jgi:pimeloyl-ACP methyl ester carboxylesterase
MNSALVEILWQSRKVHLEYSWVGNQKATSPLMVFLHEGLGSVAMWRDFPERLCGVLNCRGLVYSRPGYGRSTPRAPDEHWPSRFMHQQAIEVLPSLLAALQVDTAEHPPWIFGHSDGGSIALLYAAHDPSRCAGVIALAPHLFVEPIAIAGISQARQAYLNADLRQRLAGFHDNPDSAFWGWNNVWLDPGFQDWSIEESLGKISCPILAIQGIEDEYGTLEQIRRIAQRVPQTVLLELADCRHSPHRDQPAQVIAAVHRFVHP